MTCDHDQSSLDYWAARLYRWHNARDHKGYYLPMPLDLRGALGSLRMHGYTAHCGSSLAEQHRLKRCGVIAAQRWLRSNPRDRP